MRVRILGCGTSSGVPRVGDDWGHCDRAEPRNRRRRVSILVGYGDTRILVDTSPDLREQLLDARCQRHRGGDLDPRPCRPLPRHRRSEAALPCPRPPGGRLCARRRAGAAQAPLRLRVRREGRLSGGGRPANLLPNHINLAGISVRAVDQPHGDITSAGLRFDAGGIAIGYSTDFHELTDDMATLFEGLDLWVVDALRRRPHPTHPHLATRWNGFASSGRSGRSSPIWTIPWTIARSAPSCRPGSSPAMTGWRSICERRRPSP